MSSSQRTQGTEVDALLREFLCEEGDRLESATFVFCGNRLVKAMMVASRVGNGEKASLVMPPRSSEPIS